MMKNRQRGLSMIGFLFGAILLVFVAVGAMKVIPAYMQSAEIKNIFDAIVHDPAMQNAKPGDIRMAYTRRASINNNDAIKADEIEIERDANGLSLSASYTVKIPLGGNASLLLDFNVSNSK